MTAPCLDLVLEDCSGRDLHQWLGGAWGLLFSNPEDFQLQGRRTGRWFDGLGQDFRRRGIRALAVRRDRGPTASSRIDDWHIDSQPVQLREPSFAAADEVNFAARALRGELLTLQSRFVLLIDGSLKRRKVLKYDADRCAISAPDLLASVDALRRHHSVVRAA
jgi:thioredoxin-dependent peroxiredoxin